MSASRNTIREIVLQIVYGSSIKGTGLTDEIRDDIFDKYELSLEDKAFIQKYLEGIKVGDDHIESILKQLATNQDLDAVSTIDRSIIALGIFEIDNASDLDIPNAVSVNEAVNLAKRFGKDSSTSFVNAVLRNYLNKIKK